MIVTKLKILKHQKVKNFLKRQKIYFGFLKHQKNKGDFFD